MVHAGGLVAGGGDAISLSGDSDAVANAGEISGGDTGIALDGRFTRITNSGVISSLFDAISVTGRDAVVVNDGTIAGIYGIILDGEAPTVINRGTILGTQVGVKLTGGFAAEEGGILHNAGVIAGDGGGLAWAAVIGTSDDDEVGNTGSILGPLVLNEGDDLHDGRGGRLTGLVRGDIGADTLIGGKGADTLIGGNGGDVLVGGTGADLFRIGAIDETGLVGLAVDRIRDFSHALGDRIDLSGIDANTATPTEDAFTFIGPGGFGGFSAPGQARYVQIGNATYLQLNTDADAAAEAAIQIGGLVALVAADLVP